MGLKIGDKCYVHNLRFVDDQVLITRGEEDVNYCRENLRNNNRNGDLK
jgi:hypothetical protein